MEFLKLLADSPAVDPSTLFFFSDHDPYAVRIFANLKFGARRAAFGSKIMACPTLQWKVPTSEDMKMVLDKWPQEELKRILATRTLSSRQVDKELDGLIERKNNWLRSTLYSSAATLSKTDRSLFQHFYKIDKGGRLQWDLFKRDPALKAEIAKMEKDGKVSSECRTDRGTHICHRSFRFSKWVAWKTKELHRIFWKR